MATANAPDRIENFNFELFFELSPDLLCIAGFDGYFKRINPTVSKVLGYTNEELFARPINDFVYSEDKSVTNESRNNLRQNKPLLNFENRYLTKTGEIIWLSWTSMPVESENLVFAIAKNVTHKRKQEEDRNALLASFTRTNNDLKQLNYTTSHDLRSPVNNLLSVFSLLDTDKIQDEETLQFIEMLRSAAETLKDNLNSYVDVLSQRDSLNVPQEEIDLQECLDVVLHSVRSLLQHSHTQLSVDFSQFRSVRFNKAYMESIFLNLITNSIKYKKAGSVPVINIYTQQVNGKKQLLFTDDGLGFDMDKVKDKIFGFNQKFHDHADSKGIGLYLVYNHVISLGGQITVESQLKEGARFNISFKD